MGKGGGAEARTPYSFRITVLDPGARLRFEYTRHRETVYCIEGIGTVSDLTAVDTMTLQPGGLYSARIGEPYEIAPLTQMTLACVLTPPIEGTVEPD